MFRVPGRTIPQNANEHDLSSGHVSRSSAVRAQEAGAPTPELKGTIPQQAQFVPYLQGYIASLAADYQTALADFQKANQNDSSIQGMMAQSFEELGKENAALECYRKASMATALNPQAPYAAPFAKKKLAALSAGSRCASAALPRLLAGDAVPRPWECFQPFWFNVPAAFGAHPVRSLPNPL